MDTLASRLWLAEGPAAISDGLEHNGFLAWGPDSVYIFKITSDLSKTAILFIYLFLFAEISLSQQGPQDLAPELIFSPFLLCHWKCPSVPARPLFQSSLQQLPKQWT